MNELNKNLRQKLLKAIKLNNIEIVKVMLEKKSIDLKLWKDSTEMIVELLNKNHGEMTELLMKQGVIIDVDYINKSKVLILSSINGYTEIVKMLLALKVNPNVKNENGSTALMVALESENDEIARLLLDSKASLNVKNITGNTALIIACESGNEEIVKLLLDLEVDLNIKGENGYTALTSALSNGNEEIVKLLLNSGANLDVKNTNGTTALIIASENGNEEIVKLLLDSKANPDIQNETGNTALIIASENGDKEIVKLLLGSKSDPNIQNETGSTALIIASENGEEEIVKALLDSKSITDIQDETGSTALVLACKNRSEEIVEFILDPSIKNQNDWTSLISDSNWGYKKIIKLLLNKGADSNIQDRDGITALMFSIKNGDKEIIEMLLENNANPNIKNNNSVTALMMASECEDKKILNFIKNYQFKEKKDVEGIKIDEMVKETPLKVIEKKNLSCQDEVIKTNSCVEVGKKSDFYKFINNIEKKIHPKKELENLNIKKKVFIVDNFFKSYFAKRLDKEEFEMFLYDKGYEILNVKNYQNLCNGNRVKKLKTENKFFELRINRGDRVIFTFKEEGIVFLCVENHDNAIKRGKNKKINNLIELSAKIEDISVINTSDIIQNPIFEYSSLKEIKQAYEKNRELYKLTNEQQNLINQNCPICLYGSAGSGKTTMLLKKIEQILRDNSHAQILFLTHNKKLLKYTKGLYETYSGYQLKQINFKDVNEFFKEELSILDIEDNYFSYEKFEEWFTQKSKYNLKLKKLSVLEVFSEIKGIIKGFVGFYGKRNIEKENIISREYYTELKNKYSLLKNDETREIVYFLAIDYEKYLKNKGYYDENDLAIKYLREKSQIPKYDFLACDEVQDLTELQILGMLKAIKNEKNVFLTGDNNQAINLSFFDFGRLETLYRENYNFRDLENSQISLNQRSSEKIVELAKKIAEIREETLFRNKKISYKEVTFIKGGNIPILAPLNMDHLFQLEDKDITVIVPNAKIKMEMEKKYENTILTIYESKGMERENIICVGLIDYFKDDVAAIMKAIDSNSIEKLSNHYRYFFNLFYVAITRAKKTLVFLDDIDNSFFSLLEKNLYKTNNENWLNDFVGIERISEERLLKYAKEFEEKGLYSEALKNYKKIKNIDPKLILRTQSFINFENKKYKEALKSFSSLKMWNECLKCTIKLNDEEGRKKYQVKIYQKEKKYLLLAELHYLNSEPQLTFNNFIKYFMKEIPESKDGNQLFFDILPEIDPKNIMEKDREFIVKKLSKKTDFYRLAVDILVIEGKYKEAKKLLEIQENKNIEEEFKLFLLKTDGKPWAKKIDGLKLKGEKKLYRNFYIDTDISQLNNEILRKIDLKTLDLFIKKGFIGDTEIIDKN